MPLTLSAAELPALSRGYALLGSGGGGSTAIFELILRRREGWSAQLSDPAELDPATPCLAAAVMGSTMLLGERLPAENALDPLVSALERWLGTRVPAVCTFEGGGLNGLAPLLFGAERTLVDADLTGRAVPGLDQMSLFVDRVPGLVVACDTGGGGVTLINSERAIDIERVARAAIIQAGGAGGAVIGGFTVGDLLDHALVGTTRRALSLGRAFADATELSLEELAEALGGRLLGQGRVIGVEQDSDDPHTHTALLRGPGGEVHRVVSRSEILAFLSDGELVASAPTILVALDALSREVLEVTEIVQTGHIAVIAIPAPEWWWEEPHRAAHVMPSVYGLHGLDRSP